MHFFFVCVKKKKFDVRILCSEKNALTMFDESMALISGTTIIMAHIYNFYSINCVEILKNPIIVANIAREKF